VILNKSDPVRLSPFESRWLAEAVRLREEGGGALDDARAVGAARTSGGSVEERIRRRALILGEREGFAEALRSWRPRARLATLLLSVLALASGFGAALAVLGDGSRVVNVIWTLGGLLGLHLLSLLLWATGFLLGPGEAGGALGRIWLWLSARLSRGAASIVVARALAGLLGRARLLRWWLGSVTHGLWLLFLCGALIGVLITLAARRYGFAWETTILSAEVFVRFIEIVGWLPGLVGFASPDPIGVRASGAGAVGDDALRHAWSSWLIGCVVVYGIAPRLLLWGVCVASWRVGRARLRLDLSLPAYVVLADRLFPASERIGVTDAAPRRLPRAHAGRARTAHGDAAVLVGLELGADLHWPPDSLFRVVNAGRVESREQRHHLRAALAADPPARLLVACDARLSPDRGSLELIAELSRHAGECRIWLMAAEAATTGDRLCHWREGLLDIGLAREAIVESEQAALEWLESAHA
jgi:hypothetical protein